MFRCRLLHVHCNVCKWEASMLGHFEWLQTRSRIVFLSSASQLVTSWIFTDIDVIYTNTFVKAHHRPDVLHWLVSILKLSLASLSYHIILRLTNNPCNRLCRYKMPCIVKVRLLTTKIWWLQLSSNRYFHLWRTHYNRKL